jgi:hypothetical protein
VLELRDQLAHRTACDLEAARRSAERLLLDHTAEGLDRRQAGAFRRHRHPARH